MTWMTMTLGDTPSSLASSGFEQKYLQALTTKWLQCRLDSFWSALYWIMTNKLLFNKGEKIIRPSRLVWTCNEKTDKIVHFSVWEGNIPRWVWQWLGGWSPYHTPTTVYYFKYKMALYTFRGHDETWGVGGLFRSAALSVDRDKHGNLSVHDSGRGLAVQNTKVVIFKKPYQSQQVICQNMTLFTQHEDKGKSV